MANLLSMIPYGLRSLTIDTYAMLVGGAKINYLTSFDKSNKALIGLLGNKVSNSTP